MVKLIHAPRQPEEGDSLEARLPELIAQGKLEEPARAAVERQRAMGLSVTLLRGDAVIKQYPDGREELLATLARGDQWTPRHTLAAKNG